MGRFEDGCYRENLTAIGRGCCKMGLPEGGDLAVCSCEEPVGREEDCCALESVEEDRIVKGGKVACGVVSRAMTADYARMGGWSGEQDWTGGGWG